MSAGSHFAASRPAVLSDGTRVPARRAGPAGARAPAAGGSQSSIRSSIRSMSPVRTTTRSTWRSSRSFGNGYAGTSHPRSRSRRDTLHGAVAVAAEAQELDDLGTGAREVQRERGHLAAEV